MRDDPLKRLRIATGWGTAVTAVICGVPLFAHMPAWCDATLYAVTAREIATDGTHYQDVFDTNPPGFVWALVAATNALGPSLLALRVADLIVVGMAAVGVLLLARRAGATPDGVAWAAAAGAAFYLFAHEFNHIQRDTWMMPPALAAVAARLRRTEHGSNATLAVTEGLLWGLGCWIKPHLLFVAGATWLTTRRALGTRDTLAALAGGLAALAGGLAWLVGSGAWPHFLDVWRTWNADYLATVARELPFRVVMQLQYFPPHSACALLAVPLAVANLRSTDNAPRRLLAATYLSWLLTALLLQRPFHYVHVPETLLMLALFAANRWPLPFLLVLSQAAAGLVLLCGGPTSAYLPPHPAFDANRTRWWPECFASDRPREVSRGVAMWHQHFGGIDPVELGAVADYLREQNLRDGDLIAWHDGPHALYLDLGVRPGFRFMHVGTAAGLGKWQEQQVLQELLAALPRARFAVSDMHRVTERYGELNDTGPDGLPKALPGWQKGEFPFNQPVAFRSPGGRYLVHRITHPVTSARIPDRLDQHEPPK